MSNTTVKTIFDRAISVHALSARTRISARTTADHPAAKPRCKQNALEGFRVMQTTHMLDLESAARCDRRLPPLAAPDSMRSHTLKEAPCAHGRAPRKAAGTAQLQRA